MSEGRANDVQPARLGFVAKTMIGSLVFAALYVAFAPDPPATPPAASVHADSASPSAPAARSGGQYVVKGTRVHITDTSAACSKLDDLSKFRELATEGDRDAAAKMVGQGDCQILDKGTSVTVQNSSLWNGAECVRLSGETECLWVLTKLTDGHQD